MRYKIGINQLTINAKAECPIKKKFSHFGVDYNIPSGFEINDLITLSPNDMYSLSPKVVIFLFFLNTKALLRFRQQAMVL